MAIISSATGQWNLAVVRLPAVLATLLTTLVIYVYSRRYLSRVGALGAAAAYATMLLILQLGRLAESDAVLTLCVSSSLLVWHAGYMSRWSPTLTWCLGYALAALAGLAKGPQGPVYFVGTTWCWLAFKHDWRYLISFSHLAGLATMLALIGSWQLPFMYAMQGKDAHAVWSEGSASPTASLIIPIRPPSSGSFLAIRWNCWPACCRGRCCWWFLPAVAVEPRYPARGHTPAFC